MQRVSSVPAIVITTASRMEGVTPFGIAVVAAIQIVSLHFKPVELFVNMLAIESNLIYHRNRRVSIGKKYIVDLELFQLVFYLAILVIAH